MRVLLKCHCGNVLEDFTCYPSVQFQRIVSPCKKCAAEELGAIDKQSGEAPNQQLKAEIAALKQVTPLCPDLCKEYNQAIDDVLNLRQLSAV